ncbi:hypothetical protein [Paenibacillus beijingensis]|uniref:Spore coat protein n=1 Tax=Paenibacillus beijingensis TaxID=1126833 RepID=A0A0D5NEJ5_9BACL|nr:hypothetical protein [Paenibacillus beijingensis]AJY73641.1 hypothetical protein VN24_02110 [Paenibacillus beijingensis]
MLQPLTAKELEYIADSLSNEELLMKQCACMSTSAGNQALGQTASRFLLGHQQHYQTLLNCLQQHQGLAPSSPQS